MELVCIGINHFTADVGCREQLVFSQEQSQVFMNSAIGKSGIHQMVLLSTCNRTEWYCVVDQPEQAQRGIIQHLYTMRPNCNQNLSSHMYVISGKDTVIHLMKVICGLNSQILGEVEISGQVRSAYSTASHAQTTGEELNKLFHSAFRASRRAKEETSFFTGCVSTATAAVELAAQKVPTLSNAAITVIGAGTIAVRIVESLVDRKAYSITVVNRTVSNASQVFQGYSSVRCVSLDALNECISKSDIVFSAPAAKEYIVSVFHVQSRRHTPQLHPLLMIDLGMPRTIDPAVRICEGVTYLTLQDLTIHIDTNLQQRKTQIPVIELIIEEESEDFYRWYLSRDAKPVLTEIIKSFDTMRQEIVDLYSPHVSQSQRVFAQQFSRALMKRYLKQPIQAIEQMVCKNQFDERCANIISALLLTTDTPPKKTHCCKKKKCTI